MPQQLTNSELALIKTKGEILKEITDIRQRLFDLHKICLFSKHQELQSMAADLKGLIGFIDMTEKDINIRPINLTNRQL